MKSKTKPIGVLSMLLTLALAVMVPLATTSCETIKDTAAGLGLQDKIKEAAKDWINDKLDELLPSGKATAPVLEKVEAETVFVDDAALREEILSQLKARKAVVKTGSP